MHSPSPRFLCPRPWAASRKLLALVLAWGTLAPATGEAASTPPLVERGAVLASGQGMVTFGAGTWFRGPTGGLTVGNLSVRYGLGQGVELSLLLPGFAVEAIPEEGAIPSVVFRLGVLEVGFSSSLGHVFAYGAGVTLRKRFARTVALRLTAELRHRPVGAEATELARPGPLPASHAVMPYLELTVQALPQLALVGGAGYAGALGEGRSFTYGMLGAVASLGRRADLYVRVYLEEARGQRLIDPSVFGGLGLHF